MGLVTGLSLQKTFPPLRPDDFSWYTDKRRINIDLKNCSNSLKWKTHLRLTKNTTNDVNQTLSSEESSTSFGQPVVKKTRATEMRYEDLCHLETKMNELNKPEKNDETQNSERALKRAFELPAGSNQHP